MHGHSCFWQQIGKPVDQKQHMLLHLPRVTLIRVQRDCSSWWIAAQENAQMPRMARLQHVQADMLQNQSVELLNWRNL